MSFYLAFLKLIQCDESMKIALKPKRSFFVFTAALWVAFSTTSSFAKPTPKEPFRLYDPIEISGQQKLLNLSTCANRPGAWEKMRPGNGRPLAPECEPDTLYSWGAQDKIDFLKVALGKENWKEVFRTVYAARSPLSTFGYGPIPIRIKLKSSPELFSGPAWLSRDWCESQATQLTMKVYFNRRDDYSDWSFCNSQVIHSWSYGTPEHYDEVIRELAFFDTKKDRLDEFDFYAFEQASVKTVFGVTVDYHLFTREKLTESMIAWQALAEQGGLIFYSPSLPESEKTRDAHFKTEHPVYFNFY